MLTWNLTIEERDACLQRIDAAIRHGGINVAAMLMPIAENLQALNESEEADEIEREAA